jgi:hypothetical protein
MDEGLILMERLMSENRKRSFSRLGFLVIMSVAFSTTIFSQTVDQKVKELEQRLAQLEQRIMKLEGIILQFQKSQEKPSVPSSAKWKDKANWRLLKKGMSKSEVEKILGTPPRIVPNNYYGDIWYYPDIKGGNASFNKEEILSSWTEI